MRCEKIKCLYNKNGGCIKPKRITIDANGQCSQMYVRQQTVTEKYNILKCDSAAACSAYRNNPCAETLEAKTLSLNALYEFCASVVAYMTEDMTSVTDNIFSGDV